MDISRYVVQDALIDLLDKLEVGMEYDALNALTEVVQAALEAAKPAKPAYQEFLVSLEIGIYTSTPDEAVREFIRMIEETRKNWVYKVTDENMDETVVDTYSWKS